MQYDNQRISESLIRHKNKKSLHYLDYAKELVHYLNSQKTLELNHITIKIVQENIKQIEVRNKKIDFIHTHSNLGLQIEIMYQGHIGYAATSDITASGVLRAFKTAEKNISVTSALRTYEFKNDVRPGAQKINYSSQSMNGIDSLSWSELTNFLMTSCDYLQISPLIVQTHARLRASEVHSYTASSHQNEIVQSFSFIDLDFGATAQNEQDTQSRYLNGHHAYCLQKGLEILSEVNWQEKLQEVAREALELIEAQDCPSKTTQVILAPDQMLLQIHESIGHPLELDRILGDERNFAGWSFVKPQDFGSLQYGSPLMNVVFDPHQKYEFASYGIDESGNKSEYQYLIKDGVLVNGLGSLESVERMNHLHDVKISGVANSRSSSWNRAPLDRMANVNLLPGESTLSQMISKIEDGVIMFSNKSWSIDDYRRKFQFGCEYARIIKDGELKEVVKNPNYRGNTLDFWSQLVDLSNAETVETLGSPYCGKGEPSQVIKVGHSTPYATFKNIEIFGG